MTEQEFEQKYRIPADWEKDGPPHPDTLRWIVTGEPPPGVIEDCKKLNAKKEFDPEGGVIL